MSPDQERRLEEIFSVARGLPPQERAAYLERVCGGDAELRRQADSLLSAHEAAGQFLQPTAVHSTPNVPVEKPGDRIGRYKLLEQIGEGGFGVVWMAEQEEPVRRRVAFKIIKLGMDTKEVVARFDAERQALAMMEHPNIAKVFDGGATDTGRPYFVMELVKGVPITEYCDANKLPTRERLELFMQVCQAVQHAHQKGIIHRDLKPSNILVTVQDDKPVPKVIDFGVAKATQAQLTKKAVSTRFHQWIGTPAYMSPEQAGLGGLDVDTRSDVYSLGVLLYELLTGSPPFDTQKLLAAGFDAVMRTIREEDPPKPSTRLGTLSSEELSTVATRRGSEPAKLNRLIRGDLDWVVMRALEKDLTRRYDTASSLATDISRHVTHQPVLARPPGAAYLVRKFVRRNRIAVSSVALVGLISVLGFCGTLAALQRAQREKNRAEAGAAIAAAINHYLQSMMVSGLRGYSGEKGSSSRQGLDQVAARLEEQFSAQPLLEAGVRFTLGRAYGSIGEFTAAEPHMQRALRIRRKELGPTHAATLETAAALGFLWFQQGKTEQAEKTVQEVLQAQRQVLGTTDALTVQTTLMLGAIQSHRGGTAAATELYQQAMAALGQQPGSTDPRVLESILALGFSLADAGAFAESERLLRECFDRSRRIFGPTHSLTLASAYRLTDILRDSGKLAEAETLGREVLQSREESLGPDDPMTLQALVGLSHTLRSLHRRAECERYRREAFDRASKNEGSTGANATEAFNFLVDAMIEESKFDAAKQLLETQLPKEKRDLGANHNQTVGTTRRLANISGCLGDWPVALECCRALMAAGESSPDCFRAGAVTALLVGDTATYREYCSVMIHRSAIFGDPRFADSIAKTCCLDPNSVPDFQAVVKLADQAASTSPDSPLYAGYHHWFELAKCMADYRSGNLQEALRLASPLREHGDARVATLAGCFTALAHQRRGQTEQARTALQQASRRLDEYIRGGELGPTIVEWFDTAAAILIRAEAENAVLGREASPRSAATKLAPTRSAWAQVRAFMQSGERLARDGQWAQAAEAFAGAMKEPGFEWPVVASRFGMAPMEMAVVFLRTGDMEAHAKLSRLSLSELRDGPSLERIERAVKGTVLSSLVAPDLLRDATGLIELADARNQDAGLALWLKLTRGLAEYRSAQYAKAIESLRLPASANDSFLKAPALMVQAMAAKQLSANRRASELLVQAQGLRPSMAQTVQAGKASWHDFQIFEMLREEAEKLVTIPVHQSASP